MQEKEDTTPHSEKDWWDELTEAQKERLEQSLEKAKSGNTISSEEFWRRLKNA